MKSLGSIVLGIALAIALGGPLQAATVKASPEPNAKPATAAASNLVPQPEGELSTNPENWIKNTDCGNDDVCTACMVGPGGRFWFRADYLQWWTQGSRVVPLVTTSSNITDEGIIGRPTTSVLFGGERIDGGGQPGAKLSGGFWFGCGRVLGAEFDLFSIGEADTDFSYASSATGSPMRARPFYGVLQQAQMSELISYPGYLEGTVDGRIKENFQSGGAALRLNVCCQEACCGEICDSADCGGESCRASALLGNLRAAARSRFAPHRYRVDLLAGYRTYRLNDGLRISEDLDVLQNWPAKGLVAGTTFDVEDVFRSQNEFHGGELGINAQLYRGRWSLDLLAKLGIGSNSQKVTISGSTDIDRPGDDPVHYDAGILALDTNTGRYTRNDFVVIPQFGAEIGYQLSCRLRAHVGYTFLFWPDVVRAAEQVDYTLNTSYIPPASSPTGARRPAFDFVDSDFWAQGLNAGLEWRF
jgi:hypothetical protein